MELGKDQTAMTENLPMSSQTLEQFNSKEGKLPATEIETKRKYGHDSFDLWIAD